MVKDAKYEHPVTAEQLAFSALKAQAVERSAKAKAEHDAAESFLAAVEDDEKESGAGDVEAEPTGADDEEKTEEEQAKKEVEQCAALYNKMKGGLR